MKKVQGEYEELRRAKTKGRQANKHNRGINNLCSKTKQGQASKTRMAEPYGTKGEGGGGWYIT